MTEIGKANQETPVSKTVYSLMDKWIRSEKSNELDVSGNSMKPLLNEGMQVVVEHRRSSIKTGDIIIYLRNNRLILHRVLRIIIQKSSKRFLTKGDSAMSFDKPLVSQNEIIGVVNSISNDNKTIDLKKWQWRSISWIITMGSLLIGTLTGYVALIFNILFQSRADGVNSKNKDL